MLSDGNLRKPLVTMLLRLLSFNVSAIATVRIELTQFSKLPENSTSLQVRYNGVTVGCCNNDAGSRRVTEDARDVNV